MRGSFRKKLWEEERRDKERRGEERRGEEGNKEQQGSMKGWITGCITPSPPLELFFFFFLLLSPPPPPKGVPVESQCVCVVSHRFLHMCPFASFYCRVHTGVLLSAN